MVSYMVSCVMEENGRMENNYAARSYRKGFEFLSDDIIEVHGTRSSGSHGYSCSRPSSPREVNCR